MHYAVPRILQETGQLERLYTDICATRGWPRLLNLIPNSLRPTTVSRLLSRVPRGVPDRRIAAFNDFGYEYAKRRNSSAREGRFLVHLKEEDRTERYRKNIRSYLAQWSDFYADQDVRRVSLQEILKELGRHKTARKVRITALKRFTRYLREVEAVLPLGEDPTLGLKVPPPRPEKARRAQLGKKKGYEVKEIERLYTAINGWTSNKYG